MVAFSLTLLPWVCFMTCVTSGFAVHQEEPLRHHFLATLLFSIFLHNLLSLFDLEPAKHFHHM